MLRFRNNPPLSPASILCDMVDLDGYLIDGLRDAAARAVTDDSGAKAE